MLWHPKVKSSVLISTIYRELIEIEPRPFNWVELFFARRLQLIINTSEFKRMPYLFMKKALYKILILKCHRSIITEKKKNATNKTKININVNIFWKIYTFKNYVISIVLHLHKMYYFCF